MGRSRRVIAFLLGMVVLIGAAGGVTVAQDATPEAPAGVVREVLMAGEPDGAPGQVLELVRYEIPPQMTLPVHIHPGMQVAMVESGTLHYTVQEGTMDFTRANGTSGQLHAGEEADFLPGDRLVERQGMVHFGENRTDEPVVLLVASLFEAGAPPSTVVEATPVP